MKNKILKKALVLGLFLSLYGCNADNEIGDMSLSNSSGLLLQNNIDEDYYEEINDTFKADNFKRQNLNIQTHNLTMAPTKYTSVDADFTNLLYGYDDKCLWSKGYSEKTIFSKKCLETMPINALVATLKYDLFLNKKSDTYAYYNNYIEYYDNNLITMVKKENVVFKNSKAQPYTKNLFTFYIYNYMMSDNLYYYKISILNDKIQKISYLEKGKNKENILYDKIYNKNKFEYKNYLNKNKKATYALFNNLKSIITNCQNNNSCINIDIKY